MWHILKETQFHNDPYEWLKNQLLHQIPVFCHIIVNITAAFCCTGWDTPNPGSDLTAAQRQTVTHINTHCIA